MAGNEIVDLRMRLQDGRVFVAIYGYGSGRRGEAYVVDNERFDYSVAKWILMVSPSANWSLDYTTDILGCVREYLNRSRGHSGFARVEATVISHGLPAVTLPAAWPDLPLPGTYREVASCDAIFRSLLRPRGSTAVFLDDPNNVPAGPVGSDLYLSVGGEEPVLLDVMEFISVSEVIDRPGRVPEMLHPEWSDWGGEDLGADALAAQRRDRLVNILCGIQLFWRLDIAFQRRSGRLLCLGYHPSV
jgi:hypothetical protein